MNIDTYWPGNCPTKQTTLSTSGWHRRRLLAAPEGHFPERRKRFWQSGHHERYGDTAGSVVFVLYVAPFKYLVQNHLDCCSLDSRFKVALVSGLCTAGGAYAPTMSDVAVITHRIGRTCWTFIWGYALMVSRKHLPGRTTACEGRNRRGCHRGGAGRFEQMNNASSVDEEYNLYRCYHALLCQWNYRPFCQRWGGEFCHNKVGEKS